MEYRSIFGLFICIVFSIQIVPGSSDACLFNECDHGTCSPVGGDTYICICNIGYFGRHCNEKILPDHGGDTISLPVYLIVLIVIGSLAVLGAFIACCCKKKLTFRGQVLVQGNNPPPSLTFVNQMAMPGPYSGPPPPPPPNYDNKPPSHPPAYTDYPRQ